MNPQPDPMIGNVVAFFVIILMAFFAVKAYLENTVINPDLFTIGFIEQSEPQTIIVNSSPSVSNFESQQLYIDCIDTLVALGYKKSEAKKRAKHIFQTKNPQPNTVQEFLDIILQRS